jgi:hypothetical protein
MVCVSVDCGFSVSPVVDFSCECSGFEFPVSRFGSGVGQWHGSHCQRDPRSTGLAGDLRGAVSSPGNIIGQLQMESGTYPNVWVPIDAPLATPSMFAMVHIDDNQIGVFEYGAVEGADAVVNVDGTPMMASFSLAAIQAYDQLIANNQISVTTVTTPQAGWLAIHADSSGTPGEVLGYTAVNAGTTSNLSIALSGAATPVVWPVLHADTGVLGEFEFGTVEGADGPISVGIGMQCFIWTTSHVRGLISRSAARMNCGSPRSCWINRAGW